MSVRPARPSDAAEIARIQAVTWRTAYRSVLPREVLDDWDEAAATVAWHSAVTAPPTPGHGVLVAVEGQTVVGFAAYGPPELAAGEQPDPAGPTAELSTLLVEPRWGRRGHGSRLLAAVADLAGSTGVARLQAWLIETDTGIRRLLRVGRLGAGRLGPHPGHRRRAAARAPVARAAGNGRLPRGGDIDEERSDLRGLSGRGPGLLRGPGGRQLQDLLDPAQGGLRRLRRHP